MTGLKLHALYLSIALSTCVAPLLPLWGACDACGVAPRIIDGVNVPQSAFPTVGLIGDSDSGYFYCSGTLIAPRFVLSAAHCVVDANTGESAVVPTHGLFKLNGVVYHTVRVYFNPTYKGDISLEKEGAIDLSIWELDQDVPGVTPSPLNRTPPSVGQTLTLAGYGEQGTGSKGVDGTFPPDGTLNTGHAPIDILTNTFIKWNFRNVAPPNQESNTAPGDSGGPQFLTVDGALAVASVTSGGHKANSAFGDESFNTRVDIATVWIDSITGGPYTPGNQTPVVQSATYDPAPAVASQPATFSVAATDADGDPLNYHWLFGDGTETVNAGPVTVHTYPLNGIYNTTVIVTDGHGGAVEQNVLVQVGDGVTPRMHPLLSLKKRMALNFKSPARSLFDVTLLNGDFVFPGKKAFLDTFGVDLVDVYLGTQLIDSLQIPINTTTVRGVGTLSFDFRRGSVRYAIKNTAALNVILAQFGAINADVSPTTITVPVNIFINNVLYSGSEVFTYSAQLDKSGTGK